MINQNENACEAEGGITSLLAEQRKDEGSRNVQKGCTQTEHSKATCLAHSLLQYLPTAGILHCLNAAIELPQLLQESLELLVPCDGQPGAHQCIEYGREEEQIQYEGRQIAPHLQQVEELHRVHQAHGQHERVLPPAALRRRIQHGKKSPNAHIDCHQGDILGLRHVQLVVSLSPPAECALKCLSKNCGHKVLGKRLLWRHDEGVFCQLSLDNRPGHSL